VRLRRVANDALVAVGAARYSVPVEYVGLIVSVHESTGHYEIFHQERLVARHQKAARHSVLMEPTHYAGLLRVGRRNGPQAQPRNRTEMRRQPAPLTQPSDYRIKDAFHSLDISVVVCQ
jgi:hypothetical protein